LKRKILLLYPYYWPLYKAGGPVQSLFNLVSLFKDRADFYLVSLDRDIDGQPGDEEIILNKWVKGPNRENIFYASAINIPLVLNVIRKLKPEVVFVNGLFNINTTIPGILGAKLFGAKLIISPRGMLQAWGLKRNATIKRIFLFFLRIILRKSESWHATDDLERRDILKHFGSGQRVHIASNIPKKISPNPIPVQFPDPNNNVRFVFLSLINSNKNLHLVIDSICKTENCTLDIYGPVIDKEYWALCESRIRDHSKISYKGPVPAWSVLNLLSQYHFFILPTEGENFGHAIFDSLSANVPVIITRTTPWTDIDKSNAGFYIDEPKETSLDNILLSIKKMDEDQFRRMKESCIRYVRAYWEQKNYVNEYDFLLNPFV
jgi:hypothetical protein